MVSRVNLFGSFERGLGDMRLSSSSRGGMPRSRRAAWVGLAAVVSLAAAACGSSGGGSGSSGGSNTVPSISVNSFSTDVASVMSPFKALTQFATKGANSLQVGVVLPDTTSSQRWVDFDQPYLTDAFADAGYTQAQFRIDNAQGSDATQLNDATADINLGAKVLIVTPLDGPTGIAIAQEAQAHGVTLIAYDRAIFQGNKTYYVSFDGEKVGENIGTGFLSCLTSENVSNGQVYVMNGGEDTDPNAISFATGYNKVVFGQPAKTVSADVVFTPALTVLAAWPKTTLL